MSVRSEHIASVLLADPDQTSVLVLGLLDRELQKANAFLQLHIRQFNEKTEVNEAIDELNEIAKYFKKSVKELTHIVSLIDERTNSQYAPWWQSKLLNVDIESMKSKIMSFPHPQTSGKRIELQVDGRDRLAVELRMKIHQIEVTEVGEVMHVYGSEEALRGLKPVETARVQSKPEKVEEVNRSPVFKLSVDLKSLLANERTFLSWTHVSVGILTAGSFLKDSKFLLTGIGFLWLGLVLFILRRKSINEEKVTLVVRTPWFATVFSLFVLGGACLQIAS
jgi:uncharacterized membrane protein YidH (DUF202 family)